MEKLTIILNDPPYGTEKIYNGLRYPGSRFCPVFL